MPGQKRRVDQLVERDAQPLGELDEVLSSGEVIPALYPREGGCGDFRFLGCRLKRLFSTQAACPDAMGELSWIDGWHDTRTSDLG